MAIFHCYVSSPEGSGWSISGFGFGFVHLILLLEVVCRMEERSLPRSRSTHQNKQRGFRGNKTPKNACLRDVKDKTHMEVKRILTVFSCAFLGEDGRNGPGLSLAVTSRPPHLAVTSSFC